MPPARKTTSSLVEVRDLHQGDKIRLSTKAKEKVVNGVMPLDDGRRKVIFQTGGERILHPDDQVIRIVALP